MRYKAYGVANKLPYIMKLTGTDPSKTMMIRVLNKDATSEPPSITSTGVTPEPNTKSSSASSTSPGTIITQSSASFASSSAAPLPEEATTTSASGRSGPFVFIVLCTLFIKPLIS